ncbi:MAG: TM2 domain-containing protein [Planctomycetes bacterium]|nr:TM2 domain-containing protein [Planctomycetota bacterium]
MSSESAASEYRHPRLWETRSPWIAGILAILIPGAGHLYQGRVLKAVIYSVSILGLFIWGQKLGEGMVVYNLPEQSGPFRHMTLAYVAQLGTGACAVPALIQNKRAVNPSNRRVTKLSAPLNAEFEGRLMSPQQPPSEQVIGMLKLKPVEGDYGPEIQGTFQGKIDGQPVELELAGRFELDKPIKAGFRRKLECGVVGGNGPAEGLESGAILEGTIPRSPWDAYGSPPDPDQIQELNGRLGKTYELALVFTYIAGLLNVLAIWDCICGPAYGFGDEHLEYEEANPSTIKFPSTESTKAVTGGTETPSSKPASTDKKSS